MENINNYSVSIYTSNFTRDFRISTTLTVQVVLLIIDDLMLETDERVANIYTKGLHHKNISVVYIAQNLCPNNKFARTMSLNAHYMILFKNPRDTTQFANLACQMYPKTSHFAI